MKHVKLNQLIILFVLVAWLACDRQSREIAGVTGPRPGSPSYTVLASMTNVSQSAHITDVAPRLAGGPLDGEAVYLKNCSACHQANGKGLPGAFPPLDASPYVTGDNVERMASIMIYGLVGPIKVLGQQYASAMAGLGSTMSDEELAAAATYARSSWSNKAGPVEAELFRKMRAKWGSRGPFNITELGEEP